MNALETVLVAGAMAFPLYLLVQWERARLSDPRRTRSFGAAVARDEVRVDDGTEVIGSCDGGAIYASVRYMGMRYCFDRVVPASYGGAGATDTSVWGTPGMIFNSPRSEVRKALGEVLVCDRVVLAAAVSAPAPRCAASCPRCDR